MTLRIPDKYFYQPVIENLSYGIQEIDHHGLIVYTDATCHQILGFTQTELKGRFIWTLLTSELEKSKLQAHLLDLIKNNKPITPYFTQSYTKTGDIIDVEMLWHQNINHSTHTLVALFKNITGYRQKILTDTAFPSIFDHANEAIILIDPQTQNLVAFNHKMAIHLGYSASALMQMKLSDFELWAVDQQIKTVLQTGYHSYETQHRCQNGTLREVLLTAQVVNVKDKILIQQICHDITARKQTEKKCLAAPTSLSQELADVRHQLAVAEAELIRMRQLKDEFLASMSHELRTPLNSILGLTEALQEGIYGSVNERQLKSLQRVEMQGRHLLLLINEILDISKIIAGKLHLLSDWIPLKNLCQTSLARIKPVAEQKRLTIQMDFDPQVTTIQADTHRLKQILANLLNNAIKFTPEGGVIGLKVVGDTEAEVVRLSIWDTGIGIERQDMEQLFKPFAQVDGSLSRYFDGIGLGLILVQKLTELHGGNLTVTSEVGKGSQFTLSLPWHGTPQPGDITPIGASKPSKPPLVLFVAPHEPNINWFIDFFHLQAIQIIVAHNSQQLWDYV
ncbi:MAG: ATP-binding protein, partial [Pseudomonadota bacterium]|nr:ATP-binding protein [Pseudomonadota bacterium]